MSSYDLKVAYPGKDCMVERNEEYFDLVTDEGRERIRYYAVVGRKENDL